MPTSAQIIRRTTAVTAQPTIINPYATFPAIIPSTTTIPQPNLGPDVGPVPLFSTPKTKHRFNFKHPMVFLALAALVLY